MRALRFWFSAGVVVFFGSFTSVRGQTNSAVQFWDTTGTAATAKIGWSGTAASGKVFVSTPVDGEVVKVENGNMTVNGSVTATSFSGSIAPSSHVHPEIGGLQTALQGKSDLTHTHSLYYTTQKVDSLVGTRAATTHTHSGSAITSGLVDTAYIKNGQYMINSAGSTGQVWKSDGVGIGYWGTDESGVGGTAGVSSIAATSPLTASAGTGAVALSITGKGIGSTLLADSCVTGAKIAKLAVGNAHLAASSVTDDKVGSVSWSKISGAPTSFAPSGTAGGDLSGTYPNPTLGTDKVTSAAIQDGQIVNADISASAAIAGSKISPNFGSSSTVTTGALDLGIAKFSAATGIDIQLPSAGVYSNRFSMVPSGGPAQTYSQFRGNLYVWGSGSDGARFYVLNESSTGMGELRHDGAGHHVVGQECALLLEGTTVMANGCEVTTACPSDRRLKANIVSYDSAVDTLEKLRVVTYEWNDFARTERGADSLTHIGLIAQELQEVLPEAVTKDESEYLSIRYERLVPILLRAIQEQRQEISAYKAALDELSARVDALADN